VLICGMNDCADRIVLEAEEYSNKK
jgi:hypothetical protein